jgi:hypothetical protein
LQPTRASVVTARTARRRMDGNLRKVEPTA